MVSFLCEGATQRGGRVSRRSSVGPRDANRLTGRVDLATPARRILARRRMLLAAGIVAVVLAFGGIARAYEHNLSIERTLSEVLQDKRLQEAKARGDTSGRDVSEEEAATQQEKASAAQPEAGKAFGQPGTGAVRRAVLPDVGYSPETGARGGLKFTDRDIRGLTFDFSGSIAQRGQEKLRFALVAPDLLDGRLLALAGGEWKTDPRVEFFGLGNNEVGPDELSTNRHTRTNGRLALAWRLEPRILAVLSGEFNDVRIRRGDVRHGIPSTVDEFPMLVGIHGGQTSPIGVALIFDDRNEVTRPTQGWNMIAKYQRVDRALGNRFEFNRYIAEVSYLYPLITRRQVIGVRAAGEYMDSRRRGIPFFELSSLGGGDDMRGYFQNRFLGKSKLIVGGEYRLKVFDFNFFNLTNVKIDGVGFVDVGRVFLQRDDLAAAFEQPRSTLPHTNDKLRVSYGPGARFALGEALVARVDVGFSSEEHGRTYLTFGHTF
jgi:outer membrane protein assembly factor BamA